MIRKLHDGDHPAVMRLLTAEPELNLFIIGDVENAGYEHEQVAHWGEFDETGRRLAAVMTRYFDSLVFYSRAPYDIESFLTVIAAQEWRFFSAERSIIEPFARRLSFQKRRDARLARLRRLTWPGEGGDPVRVRPARLGDVEAIVALRAMIKEFDHSPGAAATLRRTLENQEARAWVAEAEGRMVAVAQTAAESGGLAMVIGVATHPGFRRRGYASACMGALCRALLAEGKTLCLFYDNPEAGRIYHRLGFEEIGRWTMLIR